MEDNENIKRAFLEYTAANEDNEPVYDSFTTYEWFENDVKASVNILFSGISNGGIAVSEIPREQIEAFLQDYRDNSEIRDEADSMIADLVLKSLTQQEKVRAFARENDIPFKEQAPTAETDVQDIDPYAYDGSMSLEDARKTADAHNLQEFMENYDDELKMAAALYSSDEFKQFYERRAYEELKQISVMQGGEWAEQLLDRDHLHTISELVAGGIYNQINNIQPDRKAEEIPDDLDKFYIDRENETVAWIYYNPDSSAGGQLVYNYFSFDDIFNANEQPDPMEYLQQICTQELLDRDSPYFADALEEFMTDSQDISNREEDYVDKLIALTEPRFAIYQLKDDEALRDYDFASAEELKKRGLYVDRENYDRVYRGRLRESETLDDIYERFNINHPSDFRGHSLSMSDIIAIKQDGQITAHYVDRFGFADVPDFTLSLEERVARRTLTDDLVKVSECQLASDEMDDLGDKLFNYENAPKYSGSDSSWLFGSGITADTFESITARYNDGEDVRAELAKAVFRTGSGNVYFLNSEGKNLTDFDYTAVSDESGIIFRTKGGYEISHSWETLGEAVITAARREYDRHQELNRQYREDLEVNGSLYLAMRDHRTIYLNKTAGVNNENLTDYRLEYIEHKGVVLTATNTENERVELRDYGIGNYDYIIHGLINGNGINADKYEVTGIESEPVFKVAANTEKGLDGEAFLQAYEKTERDTLIPRDILFVGSFEKCNRLAESLRLGEISQEAVKKRYNEKISQKQENPDLVIPPYDPENDNDDEKIDWSGYTKEIHSDLELSLIKGMEVGNHNTLELPFIPSDFKDFKLRINLVQYDSDYAVEYGLYNKNSKQYIHCDGFFGENALPDYDSFKDDVEAGISNRIFELREGLERFADVASHSVPVDESRRYDALETAKEYIREYISSEFEEEADFSDLSRVGLAYTTDAETELSISVYADLENYRIVKLYDEKIVSEEKFESVEDMLGTLGNLEFGDLVYLDEEQKSVVIEETEAIEPEAPEQPTFIMTSEQGETVQLKGTSKNPIQTRTQTPWDKKSDIYSKTEQISLKIRFNWSYFRPFFCKWAQLSRTKHESFLKIYTDTYCRPDSSARFDSTHV